VQVPFAMLELLAGRPEGRATLDELLPEMEAIEATSERFRQFDGLDILHAGLVVEENDGLRITEAGRSVLRALGVLPAGEPGAEQPQSLKLIDDLIGANMREKIFDLELRGPSEVPKREPPKATTDIEPIQIQAEPELPWEEEPEPAPIADELTDSGEYENATRADFSQRVADTPSFHARDVGTLETSVRAVLAPPIRPSPRASNLKRFGGILRGHIEHEVPNVKPDARGNGVSGLIVAILALLVIIICAGTVIAVTQIKSLTAEIATLEKKLLPLKSQTANSQQPEKASSPNQAEQPVAATADKTRPPAENRTPPSTMPSPLVLSPDEVRLVREYIKPAPSNGPAAAPIRVGDPVTTGTIPLPAQLVDKVPRLLGARFTIRNGTIVILKRDSRQADAVVGAN
jgi:hypothetical protein